MAKTEKGHGNGGVIVVKSLNILVMVETNVAKYTVKIQYRIKFIDILGLLVWVYAIL